MKTKRTFLHALGVAAVIGVLAALPAPASAGSSKSPKAAARKEVGSAKVGVSKARATMQRLGLKIRKEFEARPEWKAALVDLKKAQTEYNAACRPALAAARKSAEYRKLQLREQQARSTMSAVRVAAFTGGGSARGGGSDVKSLAAELKELEAAALEADPKASEAKAKLDACQATVDGLKAELDAALAADPQWASAKQQADSAEAQLTSAKATYASVVTAEKQQRIAQQQAKIAAIKAARSAPS